MIPSCMIRICLSKFLDTQLKLVCIGTTALLSAIVPVVIYNFKMVKLNGDVNTDDDKPGSLKYEIGRAR